MQAVHARSVVAVPVPAVTCCPLGHVIEKGAHTLLDAVADVVKVPGPHAAQVRSVVVDPAEVVDSPAPHGVGCVHGVHVELDAVIVVVKLPVVHAVHSRLRVAEPANVVAWPATQAGAHAVHPMLLPRL